MTQQKNEPCMFYFLEGGRNSTILREGGFQSKCFCMSGQDCGTAIEREKTFCHFYLIVRQWHFNKFSQGGIEVKRFLQGRILETYNVTLRWVPHLIHGVA